MADWSRGIELACGCGSPKDGNVCTAYANASTLTHTRVLFLLCCACPSPPVDDTLLVCGCPPQAPWHMWAGTRPPARSVLFDSLPDWRPVVPVDGRGRRTAPRPSLASHSTQAKPATAQKEHEATLVVHRNQVTPVGRHPAVPARSWAMVVGSAASGDWWLAGVSGLQRSLALNVPFVSTPRISGRIGNEIGGRVSAVVIVDGFVGGLPPLRRPMAVAGVW